PQIGINEIKVPNDYAVFKKNSYVNADDYITLNEIDVSKIQENFDDNNLLNIYPKDDSYCLLIYYYPFEEFYSDSYFLRTEEEYRYIFAHTVNHAENFSMTPVMRNGHKCAEMVYKDINNNSEKDLIYCATVNDGSRYEVVFDLTIWDSSAYSEAKNFLDEIFNNTDFNESVYEGVELAPVPDSMDFADYGLYNVKIPEGFSVFTDDGYYVTENFFIKYTPLDDIVPNFPDYPARVARIISEDFNYEIDIKADPVSEFDTILAYADWTDEEFEKLYPLSYDSNWEILYAERKYVSGNYCIEGLYYNKDEDYYYHKFTFSVKVGDQYYNIRYCLNGYNTFFSDEISDMFRDNVNNVVIDGDIKPHKASLFERILNGIVKFAYKVLSVTGGLNEQIISDSNS
ncbi:MAG: hypothetical protein IK121_09335, partial [Lachnospiraceae bacterium]|nr:hypothetical protein [Lachnospiraceae bacterium]